VPTGRSVLLPVLVGGKMGQSLDFFLLSLLAILPGICLAIAILIRNYYKNKKEVEQQKIEQANINPFPKKKPGQKI
jgi:hypothetical protein